MSGDTAESKQMFVTQVKPMHVPRSVGAPIFEGRYVHDFLNIIESLAKAAGKPKAEYPSLILPYCSDEIKRSIEYTDEFIETEWQAAKDFLIHHQYKFDLNRLEFFEDYVSNDDEELPTAKSLFIQHSTMAHPVPIAQQVPRPKSAMDAPAKQLEQLTINQAQLFNVLQTLSNKPPQVTNPAMGRCFICGQTGTHPLHPRNCPETKNLLNDGLIRFDTDKRKYTLIDGTDLPVLPFSAGGVMTYLRQQAGKTASTSNVSLVVGNANALGGQIVGITAEEYNDYLRQAATRSGKDTSARLDPYKRPGTKDRPQSKLPGMSKKPVTDSTLSVSKAQDQAISKTVPPPHPINTRDGWKEGRSSKGVTMKNETRKGPSFHFTSDIQEQASVEAIERTILDQVVTLPLRDILGVSPALQKRIQEITKTRREYLTKTGEYDLYTPQAEELLAQDTSDISKSHLTHKTLYIPQNGRVQNFSCLALQRSCA
ncbi:hypothetical protein M422DRAFT_273053 [Sphaerobolus stellatus SS14]|uniref:DUF4100 domain-containing protein n=1 Tax=Sphaerobolus stellatus (strain SS14) TaxID=990650 RepID=A0A0C9UKJ8_SPHS4|nr:hypothetical protein M422DRAFT_273053 [Sphaerobolus stellatus SS14]